MPLCDFTPTVLLLILVRVANNRMQQVPATSYLEERYANMDWKKSISPFKITVFNKATRENRELPNRPL